MSTLLKLTVAGAFAALLSAPAIAAAPVPPAASPIQTASAYQECVDWGACKREPTYCIADDKCAVALPAASLLRYDALMDRAATH